MALFSAVIAGLTCGRLADGGERSHIMAAADLGCAVTLASVSLLPLMVDSAWQTC
jgi:hypothetical protein